MLVIDEGFWNGTSCGERAAWIFSLAFLCIIVGLAVFGIWQVKRAMAHATPEPPRTGAYRYVLAILLLTALCGALVATLARSRTVLFTENGWLVEKGCQRLAAYEDRFSLEGMTILYRYRQGRSEVHQAIFVPGPHDRRLKVDLRREQFHASLLRIAPDVMKAYAAKLRENGKPLPPALSGS